jgi:hypothetical protein
MAGNSSVVPRAETNEYSNEEKTDERVQLLHGVQFASNDKDQQTVRYFTSASSISVEYIY